MCRLYVTLFCLPQKAVYDIFDQNFSPSLWFYLILHLLILSYFCWKWQQDCINLYRWLEYPVELIKSVVSTDLLRIYNESQLYEGLVKWIKYDPAKRSQYMSELFALIR